MVDPLRAESSSAGVCLPGFGCSIVFLSESGTALSLKCSVHRLPSVTWLCHRVPFYKVKDAFVSRSQAGDTDLLKLRHKLISKPDPLACAHH